MYTYIVIFFLNFDITNAAAKEDAVCPDGKEDVEDIQVKIFLLSIISKGLDLLTTPFKIISTKINTNNKESEVIKKIYLSLSVIER